MDTVNEIIVNLQTNLVENKMNALLIFEVFFCCNFETLEFMKKIIPTTFMMTMTWPMLMVAATVTQLCIDSRKLPATD